MSWSHVLRPLCHELQRAWNKQPLLLERCNREAAHLAEEALKDFSLFVDSGLLPAGSAAPTSSATASWWSQPVPGRTRDVSNTVYANNAGLYLPGLAELCLSALATFQWPCAANVYRTARAIEVSVPCHTDRQDVLVFQATGEKRWQIYHPPQIGDVDPLRRGKDGDVMEDLGKPLLDVVLEPGDVLYVPLGYGHSTSTAQLSGPSLHITLNLDSVIWGLSYRLLWSASLRCARLRRGENDEAEEATKTKGMSWQRYSSLQAPLPLGLGQEDEPDEIVAQLLERAELWCGQAPSVEGVLPEDVHQALQLIQEHRQKLLTLQKVMYAEVMLGLGEHPQQREAAHWSALQAQMQTLFTSLGWT
ncbi:unnamed protein product [Durusdinium trenchii]|uniref:Bifunctional lysine-specific demethylase and histidyl-hydroxylase n=1 Tax=Durusdinium trenchii TaxID=1381693 RepID=A0ABP0N2M7_9DINO